MNKQIYIWSIKYWFFTIIKKFYRSFKMNSFYKSFVFKFACILNIALFSSLANNTVYNKPLNFLSFSSPVYAVPPPRGASKDPIERNRKARAEKIKREKARRDSINCYITERKKLEDGGLTCIYKCPKGRTESNSIGPGFRCPTMMNVLRRE